MPKQTRSIKTSSCALTKHRLPIGLILNYEQTKKQILEKRVNLKNNIFFGHFDFYVKNIKDDSGLNHLQKGDLDIIGRSITFI